MYENEDFDEDATNDPFMKSVILKTKQEAQ